MKVILLGACPPLVEEELKRFHLSYEKVETGDFFKSFQRGGRYLGGGWDLSARYFF